MRRSIGSAAATGFSYSRGGRVRELSCAAVLKNIENTINSSTAARETRCTTAGDRPPRDATSDYLCSSTRTQLKGTDRTFKHCASHVILRSQGAD
jgi:hypothetical protein